MSQKQKGVSVMTEAQEQVIKENGHLVPLAALPDGDWLVGDVVPDFGPYVLTTDGRVQGVNYHYSRYHDIETVSKFGHQVHAGMPAVSQKRKGVRV